MSHKNTIPQNTTARRFSRNVPQQAQMGTRRAVKSTPAKEVANITAQRVRDTVQNNPPPFSQLPATGEEAPLCSRRFASANRSIETANTETVDSPVAIDKGLDAICQQIDKLSREQLVEGEGATLVHQLQNRFDEARKLQQIDLMRKTAGLAQQLSHLVGPNPSDTAAVVQVIARKLASALAHVERHTIGDWLELEVEGDAAAPPCEMVGIRLWLDSPQLADDKGREAARAAFSAWVDTHLRDPKGLSWNEINQVSTEVRSALRWLPDTQQQLRLAIMDAQRTKNLRVLWGLLTPLGNGPVNPASLHGMFELCRTSDLPEAERVKLIDHLLALLPSPVADTAIHDECFSAIQRLDDATARQQLIAKHAELHLYGTPPLVPRALNGPWRKRCQDLAVALAHQWTQSPDSAPRVLATVRRLSISLDGNDANTVERQFLLLRDLLSRIDPSLRAACLADLQAACEDAILDARMPASGPWSTATPPALVGLRSALQALFAIHLGSGIPGDRHEAFLTEWMVALHVESTQPEEALLLFRRIRFAYRTGVPSTLDHQNAPPLSPLFRKLFALHGLAE